MAYSVDKGLPLLVPNNRNTSGNRVIEEMYNMIKNNKKIVKNKKINKKNKR